MLSYKEQAAKKCNQLNSAQLSKAFTLPSDTVLSMGEGERSPPGRFPSVGQGGAGGEEKGWCAVVPDSPVDPTWRRLAIGAHSVHTRILCAMPMPASADDGLPR
ncbi:hypothetical protein CDAR_308731 [Caerostris darwini]|uniref:Uncharacterized protein n=1 Tax=Caerostris darwini TaxID=1538125 RepID=A0AAV4NW70_9ARAC|nr:hypothetical protein CDAR_308731 [Caerostris darwini]